MAECIGSAVNTSSCVPRLRCGDVSEVSWTCGNLVKSVSFLLPMAIAMGFLHQMQTESAVRV